MPVEGLRRQLAKADESRSNVGKRCQAVEVIVG